VLVLGEGARYKKRAKSAREEKAFFGKGDSPRGQPEAKLENEAGEGPKGNDLLWKYSVKDCPQTAVGNRLARVGVLLGAAPLCGSAREKKKKKENR